MNNTLHTWQISFGNIVDQNKKTICFLPERKNNDTAHLISAAPDLLQVVADYVLLCDLHDYVGAVPDAARAALRKAKGEA
jgi:hypothetical protein